MRGLQVHSIRTFSRTILLVIAVTAYQPKLRNIQEERKFHRWV